MAHDDEEFIDEVDELDRVVGLIRRFEAKERRLNFRVIHVFLFNSKGELLLQRLPLNHPRFPGFWGSSVAGHVLAGETYEAAATRELSEELGLRDLPLRPLGRIALPEEGSTKFVGVFRAQHDGPFTPEPAEVAGLRFARLYDVRSLGRVTPTVLTVLRLLGGEA